MYEELISVAQAQINRLHADVHRTFKLRRKSSEHWREWEVACERFHEHVSPIDELMERCHGPEFPQCSELREFAVVFLEFDPAFFRSGYFKEYLIDRLKTHPHDARTRSRLGAVVVEAAKTRGTREFRRYCRLAAHVVTPKVILELRGLLTDQCGAVRSRAALMLQYIARHGHPRMDETRVPDPT
ncbi:MAG: hypothetical protein KDK91_31105 [Gammaproteobacteria bacterium]|nr:hypothetical protein [Gammaproteobacteria bacterium]